MESARKTKAAGSNRSTRTNLFVVSLALCIPSVASFSTSIRRPDPCLSTRHRTVLGASSDDEISKQLERARAVLAKSKAKLNASVDVAPRSAVKTKQDDDVPFFAKFMDRNKREQVVKSCNEETGLITTDGEKMAQLSEQEQWEFRSLLEVFESEISESEDVYSVASKQLAERDVAMSMYNLRKQMHTEDYRKIFDPRNRFIGEDN